MRLGYFFAGSVAELESLPEKLDAYGASTIWLNLDERTPEECIALGERARELGIVPGEVAMWENLMTDDPARRAMRIELTRTRLKKADLAGVKCLVTLVGTKDPSDHGLAPHPYLITDKAKTEFREIVLRILDGLDLKTVGYGIEPWHNTFFYQPEEIRAFIDTIDHPRFGLHLDQMNMISQKDYYNTTGLINRTFDLLADKMWAVHMKDLRCDFKHMFLKWDEVRIGEGVMDYDTFLKRLGRLPKDTPCFCEHFSNEGDYAISFARLHQMAKKAGTRFLGRGE